MAVSKARTPLTDLDAWALAQAVAGKATSPEWPVSKATWELLAEIQNVNFTWRRAWLHQQVGDEIVARVMAVAIDSPMPTQKVVTIPKKAPRFEPPIEVVHPDAIPPKNHLIYADELRSLPAPQYALSDYPIYASVLNALVGPSGAGKSFVAVDIAGKLAKQGAKVIYIAGEGLFGYSARWEVWKYHHGIKLSPNLIFYDTPVNFLDEVVMDGFITEISQHTPALVVVDTVARCMVGGDENSTRDMGLFVNSCDRIMHQLGAGLLVVHHTGKDGKMRGSTALFGACDSVIFLERNESEIRIFNSLQQGGKNKYSEEAPPNYLYLLPQSVQVEGQVFDSAVLVKADKVVSTPNDRLPTNFRLILEALDGYDEGLKASQLTDATSIPASSIYRYLSTLKQKQFLTIQEDRYTITQQGHDAMMGNMEF